MQTTHIPPHVICGECGLTIPFGGDEIADHLKGAAATCSSCGTSFDLWDALVKQVAEDQFSTSLVSIIGGVSTVFSIQLQRDTPTELRFSDLGIPEDAQIFRVHFTPVGDGSPRATLFPAQIHQALPVHGFPRTLHLWPIPLPPDEEPLAQNAVTVLVTWAMHSGASDTMQLLADALYAIERSDLRSAIISANIAAETSLHRLLSAFLVGVAPTDRVRDFLQDKATYSYQLNVLLPALLCGTDAPSLADKHRGELNELRKRRNDLAHEPSRIRDISRKLALKLVCTSLFFVVYLWLVEPHLLGKLDRGRD